MNVRRAVGIVLVVAGVLALVYGGFSFTEERHEAELGPLSLEYAERERVPVPPWVGWAAVAAGAVLILYPSKR